MMVPRHCAQGSLEKKPPVIIMINISVTTIAIIIAITIAIIAIVIITIPISSLTPLINIIAK